MLPKLTSHQKVLVGLGAILVFAAILRITALDKYPPALFGDEIDVGLHANSLLHTGRDYMGQLLPTYIHSFSEWRAPLLMYATVPFIAIFGLNEWGVRLVPAFFGLVSIFLCYGLCVELTQNRRYGLIAAFLLTMLPWHIHFSRTAYEVTLLLTLVELGMIGVIRGFKGHRGWMMVGAGSFALTFYTYSVATVFTPLLIAVLIAGFWDHLHTVSKKTLVRAHILGAVLLVPFAMMTISGTSGERFSLISIFHDDKVVVNDIEIARNTVEFPQNGMIPQSIRPSVEKLAHNKPLAYSTIFLTNYLDAFSPQFLFIAGDPNLRQSAGHFGEIYLFMLPFLVLGTVLLFSNQRRLFFLLYGLLLIAPIPAALTSGGGMHATRLFLMVLPLTLIAGYGLYEFLQFETKILLGKVLLGVLIIVGTASFGLYLHQYYIHNPVEGYPFWQYGWRDSVTYLKDHQNEFDTIFVTNASDPPLGRTLFYLQAGPRMIHRQFTDDKVHNNILLGFDGFALGKLYFVVPNDSAKKVGIINAIPDRTAYLISQEKDVGGDWDWRVDPPHGIQVLHTTLDPWNKPLFYVITKQRSE